jgi:hypothetical protein
MDVLGWRRPPGDKNSRKKMEFKENITSVGINDYPSMMSFCCIG